jgi:hypothetical protein
LSKSSDRPVLTEEDAELAKSLCSIGVKSPDLCTCIEYLRFIRNPSAMSPEFNIRLEQTIPALYAQACELHQETGQRIFREMQRCWAAARHAAATFADNFADHISSAIGGLVSLTEKLEADGILAK